MSPNEIQFNSILSLSLSLSPLPTARYPCAVRKRRRPTRRPRLTNQTPPWSTCQWLAPPPNPGSSDAAWATWRCWTDNCIGLFNRNSGDFLYNNCIMWRKKHHHLTIFSEILYSGDHASVLFHTSWEPVPWTGVSNFILYLVCVAR